MKIIGITGGIGSGKTIVSKVFETLGISVYNSDIEAKKLNNSSERIKKELINRFGNDLYKEDVLDKKLLAKYIFNNSENIKFVNNIIHPEVKKHFEKWLKLQKGRFVIKESAILIETGIYKDVDILISVLAPEELRIKRIFNRDNLNKEEIKARIDKQTNDETRLSISDYIVKNDDKHLIIPQILQIYSEINL
jgi:dephospho-CoA kinase